VTYLRYLSVSRCRGAVTPSPRRVADSSARVRRPPDAETHLVCFNTSSKKNVVTGKFVPPILHDGHPPK